MVAVVIKMTFRVFYLLNLQISWWDATFKQFCFKSVTLPNEVTDKKILHVDCISIHILIVV